MRDDQRAVLEQRLKDAQERLASQPRATVAWQDAKAAVRQIERLLLAQDEHSASRTAPERTSRR